MDSKVFAEYVQSMAVKNLEKPKEKVSDSFSFEISLTNFNKAFDEYVKSMSEISKMISA